MKHEIIKIYKIKDKVKFNTLNELKIDNGSIKFLRNVLLTNSKFFVNENDDWVLTFFSGKSYEQNFLVKNTVVSGNTNTSASKNFEYDELVSLSCIVDNNPFNEMVSEKLSLSVRGTKSIKAKDYTEYPSHYEHLDGRGLSFFSHIDGQISNFKRRVILVALSYAYLGAIEFLSNKLAEVVNDAADNIDTLREIYIEAAKFNSIFFFHLPVLIKNASLVEAWRKIDSVLEVNISANELLEQMSSVHYILNLDEEKRKNTQDKKEKEKQEKWNLRFSIIGIVIGLLSLLELFK